MPCEILIDANRRLVVSRGTGTFRYPDYLEHMEMLGPDPGFDPDFDHLVDCRQFDLFELTSREIQDMADQSLFAATSRRAFLVSSELQFGLGRMFSALREMKHRQVTMVFRDLREATAWLGLPQNYDPANLDESTRKVSHE